MEQLGALTIYLFISIPVSNPEHEYRNQRKIIYSRHNISLTEATELARKFVELNRSHNGLNKSSIDAIWQVQPQHIEL